MNGIREIKKKPLFVQLPMEKNNKLSFIPSFKGLLNLHEKLKDSDYQLILLIGDDDNIRRNETVIEDKDIINHLKWSISNSKGFFPKYLIYKTLLFLLRNSYLIRIIIQYLFIKTSKERFQKFEKRLMELEFQGLLTLDYMKVIERLPSSQVVKLKDFINEYPDYIDKTTNKLSDEGLDMFEILNSY